MGNLLDTGTFIARSGVCIPSRLTPLKMKSPTILLLLSLCLHLSPASLLSQDSLHYRKLYLHSDREHYFIGDTLWYKGYYLDGQSHSFIPGIITMYTDLIDEQGMTVLDQVMALDNGVSAGALHIRQDLEPGNYLLRAFTDLQKQIGEEAFFYKQIKISRLESFVEEAERPQSPLPDEIFMDFLPESGILLEGKRNTMAVKAADEQGKGVPLEGEVLDSQGHSVAFFKTGFRGMGSFAFTPIKGESYTAQTASYPDFHHRFSDIVKEGIKLEFHKEDQEGLHFRIISNANSLVGRNYYFAISHRGEVIFYKKFIQKEDGFPICINRNALPAGINKLVLMDEQLLPLSERLYFSENYKINEIEIKADKQVYTTRSRVRLRLQDGKDMDPDSWSNLSMAVVDAYAAGKDGPSMNILSCLLLDTELKGQVDSPLEYFSDEPGFSSARKLDLLMLTQGWRRYVWDHPETCLASRAKDNEGFALSGSVRKVIGNRPAKEGTIELKIYNRNFIHSEELDIKPDGSFIFEDVNFADTASVFIQARNKKDKLACKVSLDPIFEKNPAPSASFLPAVESFEYRQAEFYQRQYDKLQALKEYTLKSGAFYIEEVTITEKRRESDDGHFRIYAKPSNSLQVTERDATYLNVFDFMQGRFAGVTVSKGGYISIRGGGSFGPCSPLLMLDGFPVERDVYLSIPMQDIDRVEVLKNPAETAIFGTRGGCGVVSIFTKKGGVPDYSNRYIPGTIAEKLAGYASYRKFYSPAYSRENIQSERPDHRIVLHWDPEIFTENGRATVNFFTSDDLSRYKVHVEGITRDGRICLGSTEFEVDKPNRLLSAE
jgi:hypothetical protein